MLIQHSTKDLTPSYINQHESESMSTGVIQGTTVSEMNEIVLEEISHSFFRKEILS